jgi:Flp pilus assembly protein CpaB
MFSWRRRLPPSSKLAFLGATLCAGASAWMIVAQLPGGRADQGAPPVRVVAAARDIAPGTTLEDEDLTTAPVPADLVLPGAVTDVAQVRGRVSVTAFLAGEPVTLPRLAAGAGPASTSVPPGSVGVTLTPDTAPAGLGPGDHVDVLATYTTARPYTATVAEDVAVLKVDQGAAAFGEGSGSAVTLVLDPFSAREVVRADVTAHVSLLVRGYVPAP